MNQNDKGFLDNTKYIIKNIEEDLKKIYLLDDDRTYIELNKKQIEDMFKYVLKSIKKWEELYKKDNYLEIINNYKTIEGYVSELNLCLAAYDKDFHTDGISYSVLEIGKILTKVNQND